MNKIFTFFFTLLITSFITANDTIIINPNQYFIDTYSNLIITNMNISVINSTWTNNKTHINLDEVYQFSTPITDVEIGKGYNIYTSSSNEYFTIYFTELPIISISTNETIVDEPDVLGFFQMIESNENYLESPIGIQYRGASSQLLPKKSMELKFWTDTLGSDTKDYSLLGMTEEDGWNLQAMYNEPLRLRSKTCNDLWRMINTLHYQNEEPEAINGIRMKYIELFINNEYRGLYCLGEKVNRKQLKLKKHNGNIRGELYKGDSRDEATIFSSAPSYNNNSLLWGGFEYKHPDEDINWSNLYRFINFVVNSPDNDFYNNYENYFQIDNLVDYFIFLNLLSASDNTGKNVYIAKYTTNDKYFYVPWDLDGTFGTDWNGRRTNTTVDLLYNGLYERLFLDYRPNGFRVKLRNKWNSLRNSTITYNSLTTLFNDNYNYLNSNGIYERENIVWPGFSYNYNHLDYMYNWINDRLIYLDDKFSEHFSIIAVDKNIENEKLQVYPNPTTGIIYISSEVMSAYQITIYNNLGQIVRQTFFHQPENYIPLIDFSDGIYYIQAQYQDFTEVRKIILKK